VFDEFQDVYGVDDRVKRRRIEAWRKGNEVMEVDQLKDVVLQEHQLTDTVHAPEEAPRVAKRTEPTGGNPWGFKLPPMSVTFAQAKENAKKTGEDCLDISTLTTKYEAVNLNDYSKDQYCDPETWIKQEMDLNGVMREDDARAAVAKKEQEIFQLQQKGKGKEAHIEKQELQKFKNYYFKKLLPWYKREANLYSIFRINSLRYSANDECFYSEVEGEEKPVKLEEEWVYQHFAEDVFHFVKQCGLKEDYVDCTHMNVVYGESNRQITAIKYMPEKRIQRVEKLKQQAPAKVKGLKRIAKEVNLLVQEKNEFNKSKAAREAERQALTKVTWDVTPGYWLGKEVGPDGGTETVTNVDYAWVMNNFDPTYIAAVRDMGSRKFISVPPGAARSRIKPADDSFPRVVYRQEGEATTCLFFTMANLCYYAGDFIS